MTKTAVAADLGETLDVKRYAAAQVALNDKVVVDALTELCFLFFGQVFYTGVGIDAGCCETFLWAGRADSVDISESDFDSLVFRQVNAGYTCHTV